MKKVSKIILINIILMIILLPSTFAATNGITSQNYTTLPNQPGQYERSENEVKDSERVLQEEKNRESHILDEETREKIAKIITIEEKNQTFVIIEGIIFLILIFIIIKAPAIGWSTKSILMIAVLALATFIFKTMIIGSIVPVLEIFVQVLGILLLVLSYYFIYKHDNLLVFIPICALGIYYLITNQDFVANNFLVKVFLIAAPVVLYLLGAILAKSEDIAMRKPFKKHENVGDNNEK